MPVLETARLVIRELQPGDHDACQALFRAIGWFNPTLPETEVIERRRSWFEWAVVNARELARLYQPPLGDRAIIERATGAFVGLVGYVPAFVRRCRARSQHIRGRPLLGRSARASATRDRQRGGAGHGQKRIRSSAVKADRRHDRKRQRRFSRCDAPDRHEHRAQPIRGASTLSDSGSDRYRIAIVSGAGPRKPAPFRRSASATGRISPFQLSPEADIDRRRTAEMRPTSRQQLNPARSPTSAARPAGLG